MKIVITDEARARYTGTWDYDRYVKRVCEALVYEVLSRLSIHLAQAAYDEIFVMGASGLLARFVSAHTTIEIDNVEFDADARVDSFRLKAEVFCPEPPRRKR